MTADNNQFSMFSEPANPEGHSLARRWGLGLIANCVLLVLIYCCTPMVSPQEEAGKISKWVRLKALPPPPEPIAISPHARLRPRQEAVRKAMLPDLRSRPRPSANATQELPAPPAMAAIPKEPLPMIHSTLAPLPAPPPPKPIVGSFSGNESVESIRMPKQQRAVEAAGFSTETANRMKQRANLELQQAFQDAHGTPTSSKIRQTIQDSSFAATVLARHTARTDRQVVQTTFERNEPGSRSVRAEPASVVSNQFDSIPLEAQKQRKLNQDTSSTGFKPVEILSKPRPMYTEQARRLGIEGDVRVQVLFGADGTLKVMGIVGGLGYGLDENAAVAASKILFRPATRRGEPVEQSAIVRVQFQLAN